MTRTRGLAKGISVIRTFMHVRASTSACTRVPGRYEVSNANRAATSRYVSESDMMRRCLGENSEAAGLATKRRGLLRRLDFASWLAKYVAMVINAVNPRLYLAGHLQIGK
jgi:hypothetical protein